MSCCLLRNYDAELSAFGARLGENFSPTTLQNAFTHKCFTEQLKSKEVDIGNVEKSVNRKLGREVNLEELKHNAQLAADGHILISDYVKTYVRFSLPRLPEEAICSIHDYLISTQLLANIALNLGVKDLLLTNKPVINPQDESILADTFKALVGAIEQDSGRERAEHFVLDFVTTRLHKKDINELMLFNDPMTIVDSLLSEETEVEPRLLRSSGENSMTPLFVVGIYCNKSLVGESGGETVEIAKEMAARDTLCRLWSTCDNRTPFVWGDNVKNSDMTLFREKNWSLQDVCPPGSDLSIVPENYEEPFDAQELYYKYKTTLQPEFGLPKVKRLRHAFSRGTLMKKSFQYYNEPRPDNI